MINLLRVGGSPRTAPDASHEEHTSLRSPLHSVRANASTRRATAGHHCRPRSSSRLKHVGASDEESTSCRTPRCHQQQGPSIPWPVRIRCHGKKDLPAMKCSERLGNLIEAEEVALGARGRVDNHQPPLCPPAARSIYPMARPHPLPWKTGPFQPCTLACTSKTSSTPRRLHSAHAGAQIRKAGSGFLRLGCPNVPSEHCTDIIQSLSEASETAAQSRTKC